MRKVGWPLERTVARGLGEVEGLKQGRVQDLQGGTLRWESECVSALEGQAWGPPWQGACHKGAKPVSGRQRAGAAVDVGSGVQEALSGFSLKRNSGS